MGFDVSLEDAPIHRRIDDEWRGECATAQAGDKVYRLPMAERDLGEKPLAFGATAAQAGRFDGGSGLAEEDRPMQLKAHLRLANADPFLARLFDVGPKVLAMSRRVFEPAAGANEPARQRSGINFSAVAAASSAQFRHGDAGLLDDLRQKNDQCGSSLAWRRPPLGLGTKLPRMRTAFMRFTTKQTGTLKWAAAA